MKTRDDIIVELLKVRGLLAHVREQGNMEGVEDVLYGAQQALIWMSEGAHSPSELYDIIQELAKVMPDE